MSRTGQDASPCARQIRVLLSAVSTEDEGDAGRAPARSSHYVASHAQEVQARRRSPQVMLGGKAVAVINPHAAQSSRRDANSESSSPRSVDPPPRSGQRSEPSIPEHRNVDSFAERCQVQSVAGSNTSSGAERRQPRFHRLTRHASIFSTAATDMAAMTPRRSSATWSAVLIVPVLPLSAALPSSGPRCRTWPTSSELSRTICCVTGLAFVAPIIGTANQFGHTADAIIAAVSDGQFDTAISELINAPATLLNAFLNGTKTPRGCSPRLDGVGGGGPSRPC